LPLPLSGEALSGTGNAAPGYRLGMADHALYLREAPPPRALKIVDFFVHLGNLHVCVDMAVKIDDLATLRLAHAHVMNFSDLINVSRNLA
jgi:hypothetical protein